MSRATFIILLIFNYIYFTQAANLHAEKILITDGDGFMQSVVYGENEKVLNCKFLYDNVILDVPLTGKMDVPENNIFYGRLSNIGQEQCGIIISSIIEGEPVDFELQATHITTETFKFSVLIFEKIKPVNIKSFVKMGSMHSLSCKRERQNSCTLFNPKGEQVKIDQDCTYLISEIIPGHLGIWKCVNGYDVLLETLTETIDLTLRENEKVDVWYKEENGYGVLGCQLKNAEKAVTPPSFCQLTNLHKSTKINVQPGRITQHYHTLGTDLSNNLCQIQIKLPLISDDIGTWMCKIGDTGGFINVKTTSLPPYQKTIKKILNVGDSFDVTCNVPYSSDNCYIEAPNGKTYYGGNYRQFWLGACTVSFKRSDTSDLGEWSCHYSKPNDVIDEVIKIEIEPQNGISSTVSSLKIEVNSPVEIMCRSKTPIHYCKFIDPQGVSYHLSPTKKNTETTGANYVGGGFENGECGINIKNIQSEQIGTWKCALRSGSYESSFDQEMIDSIQIIDKGTDEPISTAATIGIGVGVGIVLLGAIIGFIVYKKKMKNKNRAQGERRVSRNSNTSSNMSENIEMPIRNIREQPNYETASI